MRRSLIVAKKYLFKFTSTKRFCVYMLRSSVMGRMTCNGKDEM